MSSGSERMDLSAQQKRALLSELLRKNNSEVAVAPVSFPQQRLWLLDQLDPGNPTYNVPAAFRMTGVLDIRALERSIREIQRRHESLRTTFGTAEGQPIQLIHRSAKIALNVIDLSHVDETSRDTEALRLAIEEGQTRLDIADGPLFRATLLRLAPDDHWLLLTLHHIVSDGWSMAVLTRELTTLYACFSAGKQSPLPELSIQYRGFASRQRDWARTDSFRRQLAYWTTRLGGKLPLLQLPADHPRPAMQTYRGARELFDIPQDVSVSIKNLGRSENVTLFMTTVSAFYSLLYRYTGQEDLLVGSFIANRNSADVEDLIGFFVNTLVLRAKVTGDITFRELLASVRKLTLEAYDHQDLPFEKLVEELQPDRDLSVPPIFQVTFSFQNMPPLSLAVPGLVFKPQHIHNGMSKFDLSVYMWESDSGLSGLIEYNTDLFDAATVRRFVSHYMVVLSGAVANPDRRISDLQLLTDVDFQTIREWNGTDAAYPAEKSLHDLFHEQVEKTPRATALISGERRVTYEELNGRANELARHLRGLGIGRGDRVGIFMGRSVETVAAMVAVLKVGAAYVSLDPRYPEERLRFMIGDADLAAIISGEPWVEGIPEYGGHMVSVDEMPAVMDGGENITTAVSTEEAAYVIYTSGSTGTPKGVQGLHRNTVNRLAWMWKAYPYEKGEVCCHKTSLNFVDSVCEIFSPLLQGIPLVIVSESMSQDPEDLLQTLSENGVTRIVVVPSLLRVLLEEYRDLGERLPALRVWVTSGEALPVEVWRQFRAAMRDAVLINLYGSSEVAADVTCYDTGEYREDIGSMPIGKPIANTQAWILDGQRRLVPIGVPGELCIGGAGLSSGYLNRRELTEERFVANPFSAEPNARMYKTGDLARYLPDGNIQYLGRIDHQVKIRGFRVELEEVEAALSEHSMVREVAVALWQGSPNQEALVAYVVPNAGVKVDSSVLRGFLRSRLPEYMVPTLISSLVDLPRTPSGKTDRRRLPAPDRAATAAKTLTPPRNATEEILVKVWSEVLAMQEVGIHDNFFDLGGDSIVSIRMVAKARKAGLRLTPRDVFEYQTIAELAVLPGIHPTLPSSEAGHSIPLTSAQRRLCATSYAVVLKAHSTVDPVLLEAAASELVRRHDALRLRFVKDEHGWRQMAGEEPQQRLVSTFDLSKYRSEERTAAANKVLRDVATTLKITESPLMRIVLLAFDVNEPVRIGLLVHALVADTVSVKILVRDFEAIYRRLEQHELAELPVPAPFLHWLQRNHEAGGENQAALTDSGARDGKDVSVDRMTSLLELESTRVLIEDFAPVHDVQIEQIVLAAVAQSLGDVGNAPVLVEIVHDARGAFREQDFSNTVGPMSVSIPVRLELHPDSPSRDALQTIKNSIKSAAVAALAGRLPDISFAYLGDWTSNNNEADLFTFAGWSARVPAQARDSLSIAAYVTDEGLRMDWTFKAEPGCAADVQRLSTRVLFRLKSMANEGRDALDTILAEINLGSDED